VVEKDKIPIEPVSTAAPHFADHLHLRILRPKRQKRFTAGNEARAFLFLVMLLFILALSALARTDDPVAAVQRFIAPLLLH